MRAKRFPVEDFQNWMVIALGARSWQSCFA